MRLSSISISNFKSVNEFTLTFPKVDELRPGSAEFVSIVGENNLGKSSVLEAIRLAFPATDIGSPSIDQFAQRSDSSGTPIAVEMVFEELTEEDREQHAVRRHICDDKYRIRKTWESAEQKKPRYWAYERMAKYDQEDEKKIKKSDICARSDDWSDLMDKYESQVGEYPMSGRKDDYTKLKQYALEVDSHVITYGEPEWIENPGGFGSNVDTLLPNLIFVPAIRETAEEVSTSKKGALSQIIETMFKVELAETQEVCDFRKAGEALRHLFEEGGSNVVSGLEKAIGEKLSRFIDLKAKLNFEPPNVTADLAKRTEIEIRDGELLTKPQHQGHGAQRCLILSLLELLAERINKSSTSRFLLLVEEPETYLHPHMCRRMRDVLLSIARSGLAQVICTTHSATFLDLADRHDGIALFRKSNDATTSRLQISEDVFRGADGIDDRMRLRMLLDFDPGCNEVFFANRVCLVEGDTEAAAVEAIAEWLISHSEIDRDRYLVARRSLTLVRCRGKWTIRGFQRVLNAFYIPYVVVHDDDGEADNGANSTIFSYLGRDKQRLLVHSPNFEEHLFGKVASSDKPYRAWKMIETMPTLSDDIRRFFEFVLGCSVENLTGASTSEVMLR